MRRVLTSLACVLALGFSRPVVATRTTAPVRTWTTRVSLLLTDAPGDVQAAVVTISEIYLQGGPEGRTTLLNVPVTVNLIDLANEATEILDDVEVEDRAATSELRFVLWAPISRSRRRPGSEIFASSPTYAGLPRGRHRGR